MDEITLIHPVNPEELLWFLSRGYDEIIYRIAGGCVYRAFEINNEIVLVKITPKTCSVKIDWLLGHRNAVTVQYVKNFVAEWFDLDTDISPFYNLLKADPVFAYMAEAYKGLKLIGMPDLFEALCWAIIGQQINLTFAYKLKRRLIEQYGTFIDYEGIRYYTFPSPDVMATADINDLRSMQISGSKAAYLINATSAFVTGKISKEMLIALPEPAKRRDVLINMKGVGAWTANYVMLKSLRDQTAIPYGDAGLLNALVGHDIISNKKEVQNMYTLFEKFKGWEAYLVFYLWRSLAVKPVE